MKPQDCKKFFGQIRHNKDKDEKPKLTFTRLTASFEAFVAYRCLADSAGFDVNIGTDAEWIKGVGTSRQDSRDGSIHDPALSPRDVVHLLRLPLIT
jgi:hypothetical protein